MDAYLFTSKKLGFRNWTQLDIERLHEINVDEEVMQFFPATQTKKQTENFILKMQNQYLKKKYCYFAVETLVSKEFIGFIGLSLQTFESDFTPVIDIGWRLHRKFWNKGYATEGAKRCLEYSERQLKVTKVIAIAPKINHSSIRVMQKIGMTKVKDFIHPALSEFPNLKECVLYQKKNSLHKELTE
jgi:RimJ/RimL family protein N-acetyltransferase